MVPTYCPFKCIFYFDNEECNGSQHHFSTLLKIIIIIIIIIMPLMYRGVDKSLAQPTSWFILFDG